MSANGIAEDGLPEASRSYCVGLPVTITVHEDGRVEYEVDTAEAGSAIREDYHESSNYAGEPDTYPWGENEMLADEALVSIDHYRRVMPRLEAQVAAGNAEPSLLEVFRGFIAREEAALKAARGE